MKITINAELDQEGAAALRHLYNRWVIIERHNAKPHMSFDDFLYMVLDTGIKTLQIIADKTQRN